MTGCSAAKFSKGLKTQVAAPLHGQPRVMPLKEESLQVSHRRSGQVRSGQVKSGQVTGLAALPTRILIANTK